MLTTQVLLGGALLHRDITGEGLTLSLSGLLEQSSTAKQLNTLLQSCRGQLFAFKDKLGNNMIW